MTDEALERWKISELDALHRTPEGEIRQTILSPMPPIRCVVEPPCGHCWYCKQWVDK